MPWATPSRRPAQVLTRDAIARVRVMALRVVFAEDNYLVRQGVTSLLTEVEDIDVVAVATDLASLLDAVAETSPDVVLTDIRMPPTHTKEGIEAARQIRSGHPDVGVVVLSQYVEEDRRRSADRDEPPRTWFGTKRPWVQIPHPTGSDPRAS